MSDETKDQLAFDADGSLDKSSFRQAPVGTEWYSYYWILCKRFGAECYRTWIPTLTASVGLTAAQYLIALKDPVSFANFKGALISVALKFGALSLWNFLVAPWRVHNYMIRFVYLKDHWKFGLMGLVLLAAMLAGIFVLIFGIPESHDSLRKKTLRLVDELKAFNDERELRRPGEPSMKEAERRKMAKGDLMKQLNDEYDAETTQKYINSGLMKRTVDILDEFSAAGIEVEVHLRGDASAGPLRDPRDDVPQHLLELKCLAYQVDAQGHKIQIRYLK